MPSRRLHVFDAQRQSKYKLTTEATNVALACNQGSLFAMTKTIIGDIAIRSSISVTPNKRQDSLITLQRIRTSRRKSKQSINY